MIGLQDVVFGEGAVLQSRFQLIGGEGLERLVGGNEPGR